MSDVNAWFHIRNLTPFIYNQEVHTHQNLDLIVLFKDINSFLYVLSGCIIISNGTFFHTQFPSYLHCINQKITLHTNCVIVSSNK